MVMVMKTNPEAHNGKGSPHVGSPTQNSKATQDGKTAPKAQTAQEAGAEVTEYLVEELAAEVEVIDELAQALAEASELRDRHLRLKAEWDNYRKRTDSERADERSRSTQRLVEKLLPVLDDLERAIEHSDATDEAALKEGIAQVTSKMHDVLASEGVKSIDPKGEPFDAHLHRAISKLEDNKVPDETVLEVYQKGYEMGSRVLRPAVVVVSCR